MVIVGVAGFAQAQVTMVSRMSTQNVHYFYDGGPVFDNTYSDYGLDLYDTLRTQYVESNTSNTAGVHGDLWQQYWLSSTTNVGWIAANGLSSVGITGPAYAETWSQSPGNLLEFVFDVAGSVDVEIEGYYSGTGPDRTFLALQKQDSLGIWQYVSGATNAFDSQLNGPLNYEGVLDQGRYRMISIMSVRATSNQLSQSDSGFYYNMYFDGMQPVPEPATMVLMGMAAFAVRQKIKKSKN